MKLLSLDTSTEACSASLYCEGEILERYKLAPREHNRIILPMIQELLSESGLVLSCLDAIAFGCGPGSFTGIRIAAGTAQGLAFSCDLPLIPVSTLAALSLEALMEAPQATCLAAIDARMGEVYFGSYRLQEDDRLEGVDPEVVIPPDRVTTSSGSLRLGVGSGWGTYRPEMQGAIADSGIRIVADRYPRASFIARLALLDFLDGKGIDPAMAEPSYLRNDVARKPA